MVKLGKNNEHTNKQDIWSPNKKIFCDSIHLNNSGAICIKTLLMVNKTITLLDIRLNAIYDDGAAVISEGLRSNGTLTVAYQWKEVYL